MTCTPVTLQVISYKANGCKPSYWEHRQTVNADIFLPMSYLRIESIMTQHSDIYSKTTIISRRVNWQSAFLCENRNQTWELWLQAWHNGFLFVCFNQIQSKHFTNMHAYRTPEKMSKNKPESAKLSQWALLVLPKKLSNSLICYISNLDNINESWLSILKQALTHCCLNSQQ